MLPFLEKKLGSPQDSTTALVRRPENKKDVSASLEVAMKELFQAQDNKARALAFKAAFELLERSPHNEEPNGKLPNS